MQEWSQSKVRRRPTPTWSSQAEKEHSLSLSFVLFKPSIGWMVPTHTEEVSFLFSVCSHFLLSLLEAPLQMPRNNVQPDTWASCGPVTMKHKITQHWTNQWGQQISLVGGFCFVCLVFLCVCVWSHSHKREQNARGLKVYLDLQNQPR